MLNFLFLIDCVPAANKLVYQQRCNKQRMTKERIDRWIAEVDGR